ncbi:MAG: dihydropteroate synthase [Puniceicoccales bacterium]|jgi:dihydropteroate synthase|nr:dihydropteroate synthase [Puniceicoccales bacterium]
MGILNVTPDSFYDGGSYETVDNAMKRAETMASEGAEIIDLGGESTRPNHVEIDSETEWFRIKGVLAQISKLDVKISVDTHRLDVAKLALEHGASILNDVYAFEHLDEAIELTKGYGAELVAMHNARIRPPSEDIVEDIVASFQQAISTAKKRNFATENLILDVGIGFGTTPAQDIEIISRLNELADGFHERILIGTSRKKFMSIFREYTPADRLPCTLASTVYAYLSGCAIFRVHDVKANFDVLNFMRVTHEQ